LKIAPFDRDTEDLVDFHVLSLGIERTQNNESEEESSKELVQNRFTL
jgi:hypothetical protein